MVNVTKKELTPGMFGVMDDGEVFVVVGDKLIFECGQYDKVADMNDAMEFANHHVKELHEATCFKMVKEGRSRVIWKRPEAPKGEEAKTEEGKVTITEDEFFEIVKKANEMFMTIGEKVPGSELAETMMGLQNIAFGAVIAAVLFDKEIK